MKRFFLIFFLTGITGYFSAQCCDLDSDFYSGIGACVGETWADDDAVCDLGCLDFTVCVEGSECYNASDPTCATIPLDGGLSLLAIAGGGLATAAMRRRREEELLEKEA